MTADIPVVAYARMPEAAALPARRVMGFLLGLSFFCWAHLTISRQPFPGSPAVHDIDLYASPAMAALTILMAGRAGLMMLSRPVIVGGFMWLLASAAGSLAAADPALAVSWSLGLLVALGMLLTGVDRRAMAAGMAIGVGVSLPLMLFQVAAQTTWPVATIRGWSGGELTPAVRGAAVLGSERWLRPYGLMPHPNVAGGVAAVACVMLASVWLHDRRPWQLLAVAAAFSETLLSFSRSAWIGALAGLALLAYVHRSEFRGLLPALIVPALLFTTAFGGFILIRAGASGSLEDDSVSQRVYLMQTAVQFWRQHPLVGIGPAQFSQAEVNLYGQSFVPEPVHNALFLILAETGVVGLLGAALVAAGIGESIVRRRDWDACGVGLAVLSPLMLDHYLMTFGIGLSLMGAVLSSSAAVRSDL